MFLLYTRRLPKRATVPLLEVSSKAEYKLNDIRLEAVFQGSKAFERGGPYRTCMSWKAETRTDIRGCRNPVA
jgi:hypothetical protein